MDVMQAMKVRHSVRRYTDKPIPQEVVRQLYDEIDLINLQGRLQIQLITDEPEAFSGALARYGRFSGVRNYIALVGKKGPEIDEKLGYYGERLVLKAQMLGLNTCWVALTFSKAKCAAKILPGEKLICVISIGYGVSQGVAHKTRPMEDLCQTDVLMPEWFKAGMEAVMLAPTATNQQKFLFTLSKGKVTAKSTGGFYSKVDLGIVKYHFELAVGDISLLYKQHLNIPV